MTRRLALVGAVAIATGAGCDFVDDRFRTCSDARIDLRNSVQNRDPIHILGPAESASDATQLLPGQARRIGSCLSKGDTRRFRAVRGPDVIDTVTCVASRASYEGETIEVVWGRSGFACRDW